MSNWSLLPYSIIQKVANRLTTVEDFLAFSLVCRSWGAVHAAKSWSPECRVPWLMLSEDENSQMRSFYSVHNSRTYKLFLPEAQGKMCWGTPLGWIITLGSDFKLQLLNPISRAQIDLPPLPQSPWFPYNLEWYRIIYKAVLMRNPQGNFMVAVIHYSTKSLSFTKPGDTAWVTVEDLTNCYYSFHDVVCFDGRIYAVHWLGKLVQIDMDDQHILKVTHVVGPPHEKWAWEQIYLLESLGELLMVKKLECCFDEVCFLVYKFNFSRNRWVSLAGIGDRAMFVGENHSTAISTAYSPTATGSKSNCVYFTGDGPERWWQFDYENRALRDMGVYNMKDESVEPFYYGADYPCHYSTPIWVVPHLF